MIVKIVNKYLKIKNCLDKHKKADELKARKEGGRERERERREREREREREKERERLLREVCLQYNTSEFTTMIRLSKRDVVANKSTYYGC